VYSRTTLLVAIFNCQITCCRLSSSHRIGSAEIAVPAPIPPTAPSSSRLFIALRSLGTSFTVPRRFLARNDQSLGSFALRNTRNRCCVGQFNSPGRVCPRAPTPHAARDLIHAPARAIASRAGASWAHMKCQTCGMSGAINNSTGTRAIPAASASRVESDRSTSSDPT
jgi:hypothetical protein